MCPLWSGWKRLQALLSSPEGGGAQEGWFTLLLGLTHTVVRADLVLSSQ